MVLAHIHQMLHSKIRRMITGKAQQGGITMEMMEKFITLSAFRQKCLCIVHQSK